MIKRRNCWPIVLILEGLGLIACSISIPVIVKPQIRCGVSILKQELRKNQCSLLSLSLQLFHGCCPALLDSRRLVGGFAHSPVEERALNQTWREAVEEAD